jgi:solute carrier family 25 folate transporter 32
MSGLSKLFALITTYPYQVVRSRVQVRYQNLCNPVHLTHPAQSQNLTHLYPNIRTTVKRTWSGEGMSGFYRGLGTNIIRVLPGTCVTLVVYENIAYLLKWLAHQRTLTS